MEDFPDASGVYKPSDIYFQPLSLTGQDFHQDNTMVLLKIVRVAAAVVHKVARVAVGPATVNTALIGAGMGLYVGVPWAVRMVQRMKDNHDALIRRRAQVVRPDLDILEELDDPEIQDYLVELISNPAQPSVRMVEMRPARYYSSRANYRYWLAVVLNKYGMFDRTRGTAISMNSYLTEQLANAGWRPTHISRFVPQVIGLAMLSESQNLPRLMVNENDPGIVGRLLGDHYQKWKD